VSDWADEMAARVWRELEGHGYMSLGIVATALRQAAADQREADARACRDVARRARFWQMPELAAQVADACAQDILAEDEAARRLREGEK
jgi:hypothetical protein